MTPADAEIINNKKYMWDGREYENESEALSVADAYKSDGFAVQMIEDGGTHFLYTRREAVAEIEEG